MTYNSDSVAYITQSPVISLYSKILFEKERELWND